MSATELTFDDVYETIVKVGYDNDPAPTTKLGSRENRKCRFCGRSKPEAKFKNESHAIPVGLGNRIYFSLEECNDCNDKGSEYEDELIKYLAVERAFARKYSRGGTKIRIPPEESYIEGNHKTNTVIIKHKEGETTVEFEHLPEEKKFRVKGTRPKHQPMGMAKALMRMALFFLPKDTPCVKEMTAWIRSECEWQPQIIRGDILGCAGLEKTTLTVFKRREECKEQPAFVIQFCYCFVIMYEFSPANGLEPAIEYLVPKPGESSNTPICRLPPRDKGIKILSEEKVNAQKVTMEVGYEKRTRGRLGQKQK